MSERSVYQQLHSHLAYLRLRRGGAARAGAQAEQEKPPPTTASPSGCSRSRWTRPNAAGVEGGLRFASLPTQKTLAEIDYDAQPALDRRMVAELATLRFVEEDRPPGVGMTMLAVGLGRQAAEAWLRRLRHDRRRPRHQEPARRARGPLANYEPGRS